MTEIFACNIEEVKEGRGKKVIIENEEIALFKIGEEIFAVSNICPHQKFAKLHEGIFENGIITCPMHGWSYDVRTGNSASAGGTLKKFNVAIRNKKIFILMDNK